MKNIKTGIYIFSFILILIPLTAKAGFIATTDSEVQAIADPMLDNLLSGMENNNYKQFSADFGIKMNRLVGNSQSMNEWHESLLGRVGTYQSREYVGFINQASHTIVIWKAKYNKSNDDVVIFLYVSEIENVNVITSIYFRWEFWPAT